MHANPQDGVAGFWKGTGPKLIESASKGAVLIYSKEAISEGCSAVGIGKVPAGFIAGAGGGVCQTVVMGPCTFLVTAVVTGDKATSISSTMRTTFRDKGVAGFYPGGSAIAFRQVCDQRMFGRRRLHCASSPPGHATARATG